MTDIDDKEMYLNLRRKLKNKPSIFPNTSTEAAFSPHSQTIHLNKITPEQIRDGLKAGDLIQIRQPLQTIFHEMTHWADLIGTLWGREHLVRIYNAIYAAELQSEGSESAYWMMLDLHDADRRISYPKYYKMIAKDATGDPSSPWTIERTSGIEFNGTGFQDPTWPIFFVKFGDRLTGRPVARQPLSTSALIETNAIWSELITGTEIVSGMDPHLAAVERRLWQDQLLRNAYHPELTEYSAPAHMLSVQTASKDIMATYHAAALFNQIALNLPKELFEKIRHPESFEVFGDRNGHFRNRSNRGYVFAVLCYAAGPFPDSISEMSDWLDAALQQANLPRRDDIMDLAQQKLSHAGTMLIASDYSDAAAYLLETGEKWFKQRVSWKDPGLPFGRIYESKLPVPLIFDENGSLFAISPNSIDKSRFDPIKLFDAEWMLLKRKENFLSACR